jgi:hypothetical protein
VNYNIIVSKIMGSFVERSGSKFLMQVYSNNLLSAAADAFLTPYVVLLATAASKQGLRLRNHFFTKGAH